MDLAAVSGQRNLPAHAADDIPGRSRDRIEQDQRAEPLLERRRQHERVSDNDRQQDGGEEPAAHHIAPFMV